MPQNNELDDFEKAIESIGKGSEHILPKQSPITG